jgi:osmotically-inducible protein OsmY
MTTKTLTMTDARVRDDVTRQLQWEPSFDESGVAVMCDDGVVTLTGFVDSFAAKMAAETATKRVFGVRAVANDIQVKITGERSDPDVAHDALHALKLRLTRPEQLKVTVRNGLLTLEGEVPWSYLRDTAEKTVRYVRGVKGVSNLITIKPAPAASEAVVKSRIEDALRRMAQVDSRRINVEVHDGTVELTGNVRSWAERQEAEQAAWAAPGVSHISNRILVVP